MNKRKEKRIKRNKEIILILLRVMASHRKSMMIKNCWELANIALVIVAINRKYKEREVFTYRYIIIDIFYDWEHSLKYDMLKS